MNLSKLYSEEMKLCLLHPPPPPLLNIHSNMSDPLHANIFLSISYKLCNLVGLPVNNITDATSHCSGIVLDRLLLLYLIGCLILNCLHVL